MALVLGLLSAGFWREPETALAQGGTTLGCRLEAASVAVGAETTLILEVLNVTNLYGYQFLVNYPADLIQVQDGDPEREGVNLVLGSFLSPDFVVWNEANNISGTISLAMTQISPHLARSGSGELARGVVRGANPGSTTFSFSQVVLTDPDGGAISHQLQSCTLTVDAVPVANAQSVSTAEDTAKAITLTGSDADGDPLTFSIVTGPSHGSLSGSAPNVTYTPAANYNGSDSFTFKVNDGTVDSVPVTVSITVTAVNDAPVANPDTYNTHTGTLLNGSTVLANDTDADAGDHLTAILVNGPARASAFTFNADGTFAYTPLAGYSGTDTFTYKANDGTADSNIATVSITITAVEPLSFTVFLPLVTNTAVAPTPFTVFLPLILR
jgi:VCBS repeat-containing protein